MMIRRVRDSQKQRQCMAALLFALLMACPGAVADDPSKEATTGQVTVAVATKELAKRDAIPKNNPLTKERIALGKRLFFDPILSKDNSIACASCHQPDHGFADKTTLSKGIKGQLGLRNAPSLMNRALGKSQFWDGRAATLEDQSLQPIQNPKEMGHDLESLIATLRKDKKYVSEFAAAFASDASTDSDDEFVNALNLSYALASFQRTLLDLDSPVDRFQSGKYKALSDQQRQGLWIFESRGHCWKCHSGVNYSDEQFHNLGIANQSGTQDLGRFDVTKKLEDRGKFKTPTLRGVANTAPYMHNGSLPTLESVVEFYNEGGGHDDAGIDDKIQPLGLSETEVQQLIAFLKALSL